MIPSSSQPKRVIVVGGGISGLAAAWRLKNAYRNHPEQLSLLLLEGSPRVGGSLKSIEREGFLLETGPDCFISDKPRGLGLCQELGLENELIGTKPENRRSFILRNQTFYPIPEGFYLLGPVRVRPFLESSLLSWPAKMRVLFEPLIPSRRMSDESLASFVRRRLGQELLDYLAQPLVSGIYGADPERLSLRATFPQFLDMEAEYGSILFGLKKLRGDLSQASGARYGLFLTLKRGMGRLAETLLQKLDPATVQCGARVQSIRREGGAWQVLKADGSTLSADAVCLALPSDACAALLQREDSSLAQELNAITYTPAATLNLAFRSLDVKRPLNGIGFVIPQKEHRSILGCTFVQQKFEGRAPTGFMLLRVFLGGPGNPSWQTERDDALVDQTLKELSGWLGISGKPLFYHLERYAQALPQYDVGHLHRILRIEERLLGHPGLALAGNWLRGVGIPDCIASGEDAADGIMRKLNGN